MCVYKNVMPVIYGADSVWFEIQKYEELYIMSSKRMSFRYFHSLKVAIFFNPLTLSIPM